MPEHALLSLRALDNPDEWDEHVFAPLGMTRLEPQAAIERLADLPLSRFGVHQRLAVIHDLVRSNQFAGNAVQTRKLVSSVVGAERTDEAWELTNGIVPEEVPLHAFIGLLQKRGLISPLLKRVTKPECSAVKLANGSTEITASYETPGELPEFYFGADPMNWPVCNPFFQRMTRRGGWFQVPDADSLNGRGYGSRIEEVVGVPPFFEWRTFLNVRYFVAKTAVGMEFDLAEGGDGAIDVDHGYVVVEERPNKNVRIRSEKTVRFTQVSNAPAGFACALGWIDMMHGMAICDGNCATDLANLAEASMRNHTDRVVRACQEAADGNYGARHLVRDAAGFWSQVISDSIRAGFVVGKYLSKYSEDGDRRSTGATFDQVKYR